MKLNQFGGGGVSLNFTRIWGGLLFSLKKGQIGGSVHISHQTWPDYVVHALEIVKEAFEELSDATAIVFNRDTLLFLEKGTMT